MVYVVSGPNDANVQSGSTVGELRELLGEALSIPAGAPAVLNGEEVSDSVVTRDGQKLSFNVPSGAKGR